MGKQVTSWVKLIFIRKLGVKTYIMAKSHKIKEIHDYE